MGRSFWFECSRCGFRATVAGRIERGRDFFVQTVSCAKCKRLYDAVIRVRVALEPVAVLGLKAGGLPRLRPLSPVPPAPPSLGAVMTRLPIRGAARFRWVRFKPLCPAVPEHRVEIWTHPGKCPRCGVALDKNVLPFRVWE